MKKSTKRIYAVASSLVVAGAAVLGAGGTASAASSGSERVPHPAVSVRADDYYRWDHGVGYLLAQGHCWDGTGGRRHDDRVIGSLRYGHDGHFSRWAGKGDGWESDRSYRHDVDCCERDGWDWHHHDRNHGDR
ncbi:hypothetical protein [Streptomyces sp. Tue6028]|uniref:hypothetical protein n=1 Tax=Streptomyces sp. Tue6028 TaxID=2036037 RepID=UPI003EBA02FA